MAFQMPPVLLVSTMLPLLLISFISVMVLRRLRPSASPQNLLQPADPTINIPEPSILSKSLAEALPDSIIFPQSAADFKESTGSYWAQQECEVIPTCVVRPHNAQELSKAITILKSEYDKPTEEQAAKRKAEGLFAVRGGGHSPVSGAASIEGGY